MYRLLTILNNGLATKVFNIEQTHTTLLYVLHTITFVTEDKRLDEV